jgi:hypothetical protein
MHLAVRYADTQSPFFIFGAVAKSVSAGPAPLIDVCSQELLTDLQFGVVFELDAEAQLTRHDMASSWNCIRMELRPVNLVENTIIRTEDETGQSRGHQSTEFAAPEMQELSGPKSLSSEPVSNNNPTIVAINNSLIKMPTKPRCPNSVATSHG